MCETSRCCGSPLVPQHDLRNDCNKVTYSGKLAPHKLAARFLLAVAVLAVLGVWQHDAAFGKGMAWATLQIMSSIMRPMPLQIGGPMRKKYGTVIMSVRPVMVRSHHDVQLQAPRPPITHYFYVFRQRAHCTYAQ